MTRSLFRRLLGSLCMLWFALSIAQPALLHACPMHDAVAPVGESATAVAHHAHGANDVGGGAPSESHRSTCTCLGDCAAPASVGLVTPPVALLELAVVAMHDSGLPDHEYLPVSRTLLLPFANGPPTLPPSTRV